MSSTLPTNERIQYGRPDSKGVPTFNWTLTDHLIADIVKLVAGPFNVLPVVFVPGIMGSNLKSASTGEPVWRLDSAARFAPLDKPIGLLKKFVFKNAGERQRLLHPDRVVVDDGEALPKQPVGTIHDLATFKARGWGTVGEGSYHEFLCWLEDHLNPSARNPALWRDYFQAEATVSAPLQPGEEPKLFPGIRMGIAGEPFGAQRPFVPLLTDDLLTRSKFQFPVYAVGYNWLASNKLAAEALADRIQQIIAENNKGQYTCQQVVVVTHSMGGLVGRACAQLVGMSERIAGVVHGVMPSVGAAVAYRRCKVGMADEDLQAALVIGRSGREVTAVFAQAPGALQLLPSQNYRAKWLSVYGPDGTLTDSWPKEADGNDPYQSIYANRDRWWGLVNEAWLSPQGGQPIDWERYMKNVLSAKAFHTAIAGKYHPNSYVYFGADKAVPSFEGVAWRIAAGNASTPARGTVSDVMSMGEGDVGEDAGNPRYVGRRLEVIPFGGVYETSDWELHCDKQDGGGDGTVPASSGGAPLAQAGADIQQQFPLNGIDHEGAYRKPVAQRATLYAITKIAASAKRAV
jgi:hypothetical protein